MEIYLLVKSFKQTYNMHLHPQTNSLLNCTTFVIQVKCKRYRLELFKPMLSLIYGSYFKATNIFLYDKDRKHHYSIYIISTQLHLDFQKLYGHQELHQHVYKVCSNYTFNRLFIWEGLYVNCTCFISKTSSAQMDERHFCLGLKVSWQVQFNGKMLEKKQILDSFTFFLIICIVLLFTYISIMIFFVVLSIHK